MRPSTVSPVFAGRDAELTALLAAFARIHDNSPELVLLGGEAGVGKSRLIEEFATRIHDDNPGGAVLILKGACLELGSTGLPYAPFTAALREHFRDYPREHLTDLLPPHATHDLARILPELGEEPETRDSDTARARLFEHLLALLERIAARQPLVLVIEDAHWADHSTRDLLSFLTRNLRRVPVMLVVTYRSDELHRTHPMRRILAALTRIATAGRIELSRLTPAEVHTQLSGILGRSPDPAVTALVHSRSAGIPLFVEAMVGPDGTPPPDLPASLRDLLLANLDRLPEVTRRTLRTAAVAGDRVGHTLLAAVTGLRDPELSEVVRQAVATHVLVPDGDGYAFRHALIREAVRHDLLPAELRALHRTYAEHLESDSRLSTGPRPMAELATHWSRAHGDERALPAAWAAASEAAAAAAYGESLHMLEMVLDLWHRVPDAAERTGVDRTAVLELAVESAFACGELDTGLAHIEEALAILDGESEPERRALALISRARLRTMRGVPGMLDDIVAAEKLVPSPGPVRASILARLGGELLMTGDKEAAQRMIGEAAGLAREYGDRSAESDVFTAIAIRETLRGNHVAALRANRESRLMAERGRSAERILRTYINHAGDLSLQARYEESMEHSREGLALAVRLGHLHTSALVIAVNLAEAHLALGRWDEVPAIAERYFHPGHRSPYRGEMLLILADIAVRRGEHDRATALMDEVTDLLATVRLDRFGRISLARVTVDRHLAAGDHSAALTAAHDALNAFRPLANPLHLWPLLYSGMRACAHAAVASAPAPQVLALHADLMATAGNLPAAGPFQLARSATVTALAGPADLPVWERAVTAWEEAREPHHLADTLTRFATHLLATGDRVRAAACLRRAADIAATLRAGPLHTTIDELSTHAHALTGREREVLRLVANGMSNRAIAAELFISAKTVSVHVSNILAKLHASSRGEAAAVARRSGLLH
ncbi:helix-turn-helix transcriptional regulator [Sinosporangium siamense]|uniref:Helix-turn-helix transcriptional regulator n=1 Tax=Sinosporangium siamense TaxID=1367973 RepID=A0A919RJF5_9ACTN|nr:LuxR family transcriptional regulator [Sinosporangium siamense]GII94942.1 helix-turn-helix transcriptional regulator [Sinosporangium siamense]